jgi:hypothetical protein
MFSKQDTVNVLTSSTALIPAAPNRKAIIISGPPTNRFTLSLNATAVLDQGITLYASNVPLALNASDHGDIVTRAWTAISATASQNVTIVSVFD